MINQRTKDICKKRAIYPNAPSFKGHQEFMRQSSRALWKQYIEIIKNNRHYWRFFFTYCLSMLNALKCDL